MIKLGRKPREIKWTQAYKEEKDIRIKGIPAVAVKEKAPEKEIKKEAAPLEEKKPVAPKKAAAAKESGEEKKEPKEPKKESRKEIKTAKK